jgi:hypothetical protein
VAPQGTGLAVTAYRGAFAADGQWAHGWTALYDLGYLQGVLKYQGPACAAVTLSAAVNGANVEIRFLGEPGLNYPVQSTTDLSANPIAWTNEGAPLTGSGSITFTGQVSASPKFYRIVCQ